MCKKYIACLKFNQSFCLPMCLYFLHAGTDSGGWDPASQEETSSYAGNQHDSLIRRLQDSGNCLPLSASEAGSRSETSISSMKPGPRDSVSSVESDIAILAHCASLSKMSHPITESENEHLPTVQQSALSSSLSTAVLNKFGSLDYDTSDSVHVTENRDHVTDSNGLHWLKDGKSHITPLGSPLSNSVCSSMVSSVYENTLSGGGDERSHDAEDFETIADTNKNGSSSDDVILRRSVNSEVGVTKSSVRKQFLTVEGSDVVVRRSAPELSAEKQTKQANREVSIYDIDVEDSNPSIYATADEQMIEEHNSSDTTTITDQSMSTPVVRRHNRSTRSASPYRHVTVCETVSEQGSNLSVNSPDFPSHLSPIKRPQGQTEKSPERTRSKSPRGRIWDPRSVFEQSRDSPVRADDSEVGEEQVYIKNGGTDLETSGTEPSTSVPTPVLPWEASEQSSHSSGRDESLNHEEFVNIDHR